MTFENLVSLIQAQFTKMCATGKLFRVKLPYTLDSDANEITTGYQLSKLYLESFKPEDNPVFRHPDSTTHNCTNDKNFIKNYGNVVTIINDEIVTIWDLELEESNPYYSSCKMMSQSLKTGVIEDIFVQTFDFLHKTNYEKTNKNQAIFRLGREKEYVSFTEDKTFGNVEANKPYLFTFFHVYLPKLFVDFSGKSIEAITGELRTTRQLFEKTLSIPLETLELVRDLIQQGSLLRGDMYLNKVLEVIKLKKQYETVQNKSLWLWDNFQSIPFARFANELIGTTCIELAEGKEINSVCKDFNIRVDPINYNKAKSPVTKQMIEIAEKQIQELGYIESFDRRFATIDDIDVNEIKHTNINNTVDKPVGLFGKAGVPTTNQFSRHKRAEFDGVETVHIDKFMSEILPNVASMEVFLENRMEGNLVALFTSLNECKNLFKWNNAFSWTYNGNLSGKSMIKEAVKSRGGNVDADLRISLFFPNTTDDYDLHVIDSNGNHIYYSNVRKEHSSSGVLDLDAQGKDGHQPAEKRVENVVFTDISKLKNGDIKIYVNNWSKISIHTAFDIEVEIFGQISRFTSGTSKSDNYDVGVIKHTNGNFDIKFNSEMVLSKESSVSRKIWNLETNQFHKVNLVCTSPNHWGTNNVGTKEYFFMLQNCKADQPMRAFHIDQLNSELMNIRKSLELLGNYKLVEPSEKQLSGIGFNCTTRDELIVKLSGSFKRIIKIQF